MVDSLMENEQQDNDLRAHQGEILAAAEAEFKLGPVAMAAKLWVPYPTYKDWKSGRHPMPALAMRCLQLLRVIRAQEK